MAPVSSYAESVWGTCNVENEGLPTLSGTWVYRLEISWDTSGMGDHGMSHISFLLELGVCDCACEENLFAFSDTAGTGIGEGGCELLYYGLYECVGDPSFPASGPTIKYEHYEGDCEPGGTGSATLYFMSGFAPGDPMVHVDALGIKAGTAADKGDLTGVLPLCQCTSPVDGVTWGVIKAVYK
jgi:hypothetical protein